MVFQRLKKATKHFESRLRKRRELHGPPDADFSPRRDQGCAPSPTCTPQFRRTRSGQPRPSPTSSCSTPTASGSSSTPRHSASSQSGSPATPHFSASTPTGATATPSSPPTPPLTEKSSASGPHSTPRSRSSSRSFSPTSNLATNGKQVKINSLRISPGRMRSPRALRYWQTPPKRSRGKNFL